MDCYGTKTIGGAVGNDTPSQNNSWFTIKEINTNF